VLSDVLSSHRFDLYGLVPQGKAIDAEFSLDPLPQSGLAYAVVSFTSETDRKALESAVRSILKKVAHDGVPPDLVEAAKVHERSEAEFQKNSIAGSAAIWSDAVALYGLDLTLCSTGFFFLRSEFIHQSRHDSSMTDCHERIQRKNAVSGALYLLSVPLAYVSIYASFFIFALIPATYFLPEKILAGE